MKLEMSRWILEKNSNIKLHKNPSGESQVLCGQTVRHDAGNGRFFAILQTCLKTLCIPV